MSEVGLCTAGGGPAGMMLGLLLARHGVEVLVLEKQGNLLRGFRADRSSLDAAAARRAAVGRRVPPRVAAPGGAQVGASTDDGTYVLADFGRLARSVYPAIRLASGG